MRTRSVVQVDLEIGHQVSLSKLTQIGALAQRLMQRWNRSDQSSSLEVKVIESFQRDLDLVPLIVSDHDRPSRNDRFARAIASAGLDGRGLQTRQAPAQEQA